MDKKKNRIKNSNTFGKECIGSANVVTLNPKLEFISEYGNN